MYCVDCKKSLKEYRAELDKTAIKRPRLLKRYNDRLAKEDVQKWETLSAEICSLPLAKRTCKKSDLVASEIQVSISVPVTEESVHGNRQNTSIMVRGKGRS